MSDLSERPGFFRPIVDTSPAGIARVYSAAEGLFTRLGDELKKFQVSGSLPYRLLGIRRQAGKQREQRAEQ